MQNPDKQSIRRAGQRVPYDEWIADNLREMGEENTDAILRAREHGETLKHRGHWSTALICVVILINVVSLGVVIAIGLGKLRYNNAYSVPAIIGANFAETWALTKIAMKFYFHADSPDRSRQGPGPRK
ncbi:MAG: hypothetical protein ACQR33_04075 [Candidatus Saccharibacteria bacterium]